MKILSLDLSTSTGYALIVDGVPKQFGLIEVPLEKFTSPYPANYVHCVRQIAKQVIILIESFKPEVIVIEETNIPSRGFGSRYNHKILEWIHMKVNELICMMEKPTRVAYLSSSQWRKILDIKMSEQQKEQNDLINHDRANKKHVMAESIWQKINDEYSSKIRPETTKSELRTINKEMKSILKDRLRASVRSMPKTKINDKVSSRINLKTLSVNKVNEMFKTNFKATQHDVAEAILLGVAYLRRTNARTS